MHNTSTFREIAELWKENRRNVVKHSTYCAYALILKTHLMPVFADSVSISEAEVQQFALDKLEAGLSKKTVHDIIAVLKSVGRFGAKRGMFEMPSWDIEYPSDTSVRVLPVLSLPDHKKTAERDFIHSDTTEYRDNDCSVLRLAHRRSLRPSMEGCRYGTPYHYSSGHCRTNLQL